MSVNSKTAWIRELVSNYPDVTGGRDLYKQFQNETGAWDWKYESFTRAIRKQKKKLNESPDYTFDEEDYLRSEAHNQKKQDQNSLLRKENRETYRLYNNIESLYEELIEKVGNIDMSACGLDGEVHIPKQGKVGILTLADLHINEIIRPHDTDGNCYNYEIFSKRLKKFIIKSTTEFNIRGVNTVYVFMLGDFINSPRRLDERISMQSSLTNACLLGVNILSQAIIELSKSFNVKVAYCVGNESRITEDMYSNQMLAMENWDFLIFNMMRMLLGESSIEFISSDNPIQSLIPIQLPGGNVFNAFITHGHIFKGMPDEKKVGSILQNYARKGTCINGIFLGHFHNTRIGDFIQISGSMKGGDAWSFNDKGFTTRAAQNIYIVNDDMSLDAMKMDVQNTSRRDPMYKLPDAFNEDAEVNTKLYNTVMIKTLI